MKQVFIASSPLLSLTIFFEGIKYKKKPLFVDGFSFSSCFSFNLEYSQRVGMQIWHFYLIRKISREFPKIKFKTG